MPEMTMPAKPWTYGKDSREGGRPTQEDRCETLEFQTADKQAALFAMVADGVGGRNTGELASQWAKEMIPALLSQKAPTASEVPAALVEAFEAAHDRIYSEVLDNPSRAGMGTTCTVVVIIGRRLYLAHVGDSRAYLIRGNQIHQLSIDHTWAEEAIQAGRSREEIRNHPNRGVIKRCLGINEDVDVDTRYRKLGEEGAEDSADRPLFLEDGDRILLCTDGVSDVLEDARLLEVVRRHPAAEDQAARAVIQAALKANAKDNVTAVVVDLPGAVVAGGRRAIPIGAIIGAVALLLLIVGAGAAFALLSRPSQPTSVPVSGTPTTVLTATLTRPVVAVATATPLPATRPQTVASVASATPTVLPGGPTYTPIPTFTVAPTVTSVPTGLPVGPTVRPPSATSNNAAPVIVPPMPLAPPPGETVRGRITLKWQGINLATGLAYQVVWWPKDGDPSAARTFASPTTETVQEVNISALGLQDSQAINWAVLVVNQNSGAKLLQPTNENSRSLVFKCIQKCNTCTTCDADGANCKNEPCECQQVCD